MVKTIAAVSLPVLEDLKIRKNRLTGGKQKEK